jgi:hypothetical protein
VTVSGLLARARACVGHACVYGLGGGDTNPYTPDPWDDSHRLDCSAYVMWCLGLRKFYGEFAWLRRVNGGWYNTTGIYHDAVVEPTGHFDAILHPEPGCVVVYPARSYLGTSKGPQIGHVGIVTGVSEDEATKVIHCSSGNYRKTGDAIQETDLSVFLSSASTVFAWCANIERRVSPRRISRARSKQREKGAK